MDTNFVNPNGVHNGEHYSTAYDISLIGNYAMKNETFRSFVCKTYCYLPPTDIYLEDDRYFTNTNSLIIPSSIYYYPEAIGVKTGYTSQAKNCLVATSIHNGTEFLSVVLGSGQNDGGVSQRYTDTINMLNMASSNYTLRTLKCKNDVVSEVYLENYNSNLTLVANEDFIVLDKVVNTANYIEPEILLSFDTSSSIKVGDVVGMATYFIDGREYTFELIAGNNVQYVLIGEFALKIIMLIILIILICILLFPKYKKHNVS